MTQYDPRYLAGLALYHHGRYWDSHEEWEEMWRETVDAERHLLQALIQVDAAIIHTGRGHWGGVANLLARSLRHLEQCPPTLLGMDIVGLRDQLLAYRSAILELKDGERAEFDWALLPGLEIDGVERESLLAMREEAHAADQLD